MQKPLTRYLIIFTLAQLPMLAIAAFFPYLVGSPNTSPSLRILLRTLLDFLPSLILTLFFWYDMARVGKVSPLGLLLTFTNSLAGLLMYRYRQPLLRKYYPIVIIYPFLLCLFVYFFPAYTTFLSRAYQLLTLFFVIADCLALHLSFNNITRWMMFLIFITCITSPSFAILAVLLLYRYSLSAQPGTYYTPLLTYLLPIAIFSLTRKICTYLPLHILLLGLPASVFVPTAISFILFILIVVMLYRDAPKTGLPRFWLCASAIGSASVSALCCLFARQDREEKLPATENMNSNSIQQQ